MGKVMEDKFKLLKESFMNTPVKIIVLEDVGPMVMPDGRSFSARKGEEREVPRWVAYYLEKKGFAKRRGGEITLDEIIKIHYREVNRRSMSDIDPLPTNFYWLVREFLDDLDKTIKESPDPVLIERKRKVEGYIREIFEKRLQALLTMAIRGGDIGVLKQRILPEEAVLLDAIYDVIVKWRKNVLGMEE